MKNKIVLTTIIIAIIVLLTNCFTQIFMSKVNDVSIYLASFLILWFMVANGRERKGGEK